MRSRPSKFAANLGDSSAKKLFMNLGQLTGHDDAKLRPKNRLQIGERIEQTVRRFVENQSPRGFAWLSGEIFESRPARAGLLRQESEKFKFVGRQSRSDQRADSGIGTGNGKTCTPAAMASRTSHDPGSLTPGVPASETSATALPGLDRCD